MTHRFRLLGLVPCACLAALVALEPACTDVHDLAPFPCAQDGTCPEDLVCAAGFCRQTCFDATGCPEDKVCVSGDVCQEVCELGGEACREGLSCKAASTVSFDSFVAICAADGVGSEGSPCANIEECGAGLSCTGVCVRTCASDDDCADGGCTLRGDVGVCKGCTLFGNACASGTTCAISGSVAEGGFETCTPTGEIPLGELCAPQTCPDDAVCWGSDEIGYFCRPLCDDEHSCPSGPCTPIEGVANNGGVCESG